MKYKIETIKLSQYHVSPAIYPNLTTLENQMCRKATHSV